MCGRLNSHKFKMLEWGTCKSIILLLNILIAKSYQEIAVLAESNLNVAPSLQALCKLIHRDILVEVNHLLEETLQSMHSYD